MLTPKRLAAALRDIPSSTTAPTTRSRRSSENAIPAPLSHGDNLKHAACHWLVNFNRELAVLAESKREWRIVTSKEHSTVWDSDETLFDMNFLALGVDADEAWRLARQKGKILAVGKEVLCHLAQFYKDEDQPIATPLITIPVENGLGVLLTGDLAAATEP
jgi:hypothetical protein